jgi:hypothetical protein
VGGRKTTDRKTTDRKATDRKAMDRKLDNTSVGAVLDDGSTTMKDESAGIGRLLTSGSVGSQVQSASRARGTRAESKRGEKRHDD